MIVHLKRLITVIIILLPGPKMRAQTWKIAQLRDPNPVVNVYNAANDTSEKVATITKDEIFYCEPGNAGWWHVRTTKPIWGYIPKSQIQLIEELSVAAQQKMLLSIFTTHRKLGTDFISAYESKDSVGYFVTINKLDEHRDRVYRPILNIFSNHVCKTGDTLVIRKLLETVPVDGVMESDARDLAMGEAFICKSDLFINALNSINNKDDRFYVSFHIGFGLLQHYQKIEKQLMPKDPVFIKLAEKLDAVEKASMPGN
ncbi:SH3 domain-containing protein [Niastella koreensis]|nr:SH3 domain-containing protein [Niastella koreensis]